MISPSAVRIRLAAITSLALASTDLSPPAAGATAGQWSPSVNWSNSTANAVHLMIMPGDGAPHHSRVLWFRGSTPGAFGGGEWNWNPGDDGCAAFPSARFTPPAVTIGPTQGYDVFCAGHTALADGRILMVGGTDFVTGLYGTNQSRIYERGVGSNVSTWTDPGQMVERRW